MLNDVAPPHRCDDHADTDDAPYCGACMSQQKIHAKWLQARQAEEQLAERDAELERRAAQLELADAAIEDCKLCDSSGYIFGAQVCDHVDRRETNRKGSALVRAELARLAAEREVTMKRRSLEEILKRARFELERNPDITVYAMVDGREVRRSTAPWRRFRQQMRQLGQAYIRVKVSTEGFSERLQRGLAAMPDAEVHALGLVRQLRGFVALSVDHSLSPAPLARHPDLDVFDAALSEFESRMDCPHDSSSGGYGPDRTWRCDECGEITGREEER